MAYMNTCGMMRKCTEGVVTTKAQHDAQRDVCANATVSTRGRAAKMIYIRFPSSEMT